MKLLHLLSATIPKILAMQAPTKAPINPTTKDNLNPFNVLVNISLPSQSVPKMWFHEGGRLF